MKKSLNGKSWGVSTRHHIVSRSIGGPDVPKNIYRWAKKKHQAYHQLFYNFLPSTVTKIIEEWIDGEGNLITKKIGLNNLRAWKKLFGDQKPAEAIKFIEKEFLPIEIKFLNDKLGG